MLRAQSSGLVGLESHLVVTLQFRCPESFVYISLLSLNVKMYVYFVDFKDSPFDIYRAVKLQSFSHLASEIIFAALLLLVFRYQLVQKLGVCK